jgi:hypothetical protein
VTNGRCRVARDDLSSTPGPHMSPLALHDEQIRRSHCPESRMSSPGAGTCNFVRVPEALYSASKVTAIAEISTNAPFVGRAATWIVARAGNGFVKKLA